MRHFLCTFLVLSASSTIPATVTVTNAAPASANLVDATWWLLIFSSELPALGLLWLHETLSWEFSQYSYKIFRWMICLEWFVVKNVRYGLRHFIFQMEIQLFTYCWLKRLFHWIFYTSLSEISGQLKIANQYIVHLKLEKCWAGWSTSWNQDCQEKYQ